MTKLSSETLEDIADMEIVERELQDFTMHSELETDRLTDTDNESSSDFSLVDLDHEEKVEKNATSYQWPTDLLAPGSLSAQENNFFCGSCGELYSSSKEELTDTQLLDAERQYHRAAITELEEKHKEQMVAYAAELQELLKVQATLEDDLTRTAEHQRELLTREKEDLHTQLVDVSRIRDALFAENGRLSKEAEQCSLIAQGEQVKVADFEQLRLELLACRDSLSTQLKDRNHELNILRNAVERSDGEMQSLSIARDDAEAESARLRHELRELRVDATTAQQHRDDLVDSNNVLHSQLDDAAHELHMERMRAVESADEVLALTEARDSIGADFDRASRERDELKNKFESTNKTRELETERFQAISAASDLSNQVSDLTRRLDDEAQEASRLIQNKEENFSILRAEMEMRINDLMALAAERDRLTGSQASFLARCDELSQENSRLNTTLESKNQQLHAVYDEIDNLTRAKDSQDTTIRDLRAQLTALKSSEEKSRESSQQRSFTTGGCVIKRKEGNRALEEEKRKGEEALRAHAQEIEDLQGQLHAAVESTRASSLQVNEFTRKMGAKDRKIQALRFERESLKQENVIEQGRIRDLRTRLANTESEQDSSRNQMQTQMDAIQAQCDRLAQENSQLKETLKAKDRKIQDLRTQRNSLRSDLGSSQRQQSRAQPSRDAAQPDAARAARTAHCISVPWEPYFG
ncbi:hypothetical protein BT96DRAFT_946372 [Gymnopus androsaceus JB14]|uniref:Uncharacterized protein n=1 Tax=Gymnopus androsaceus JB14 TaxID=1447944 RepID=A0A6A4GWA9_9AGAR|nr:hypothetical protein BT96DRAFT_946372 [Gymnopus androsaceus JB14]